LFLILINQIITFVSFRHNGLYVMNRIDLINILNFICLYISNNFSAIISLRFVVMRSRRYNFIMELIFLLKCFQIINIILFLLILLPIVVFFLFSIHFAIILTKIVKLWLFRISKLKIGGRCLFILSEIHFLLRVTRNRKFIWVFAFNIWEVLIKLEGFFCIQIACIS